MPPSCTLRDIRRAMAPKTGYFLARTATSGTVSSLTDSRPPVRSGNIQDDLFEGKWILRPDATDNDKVRMVAENGYLSSTGTLQPDVDWSAPPTAGEVYEVHGGSDPWEELNDVINTALRRCYVISEIALAATVGMTRHGLNTAAPWLQAAGDVREFGYLLDGESRNEQNPYLRRFTAEPVDDEGQVYLDHHPRTFIAGEVLYCRALKPAYYACRTTTLGAFGERTGLAEDAHECPVALEWAMAAGMVEYWERYAGSLPDGDPLVDHAYERQARWAAIYDTLRSRFLHLPANNMLPRVMATGLGGRH
jgi:hypothetical protein